MSKKKEKEKQPIWNKSSEADLVNDYPLFADFIKDINWYGDNTRVRVLKSGDKEKLYKLKLYSEKHEYSIIVGSTYISAGLSNRYCLPGETWTRGRDLPDGDCDSSTIKRIVNAILACEILPYENEVNKQKSNN